MHIPIRVSFCLLSLVCAAAFAADSQLAGAWKHQRDSGGWKVLPGGEVTLRLDSNGQAHLDATAPKQNPMRVAGTWSERSGRVTINVPGQFEISNGVYKLQGDTVTFPSELSSDKPGSSTWVRVTSQGMDLIFVAFNRAVEDGKGGATAAEEAAKEARKQKGVEKAEVISHGEALELTVAGAPVEGKKPRMYIWFANKRAPQTPPVQGRTPVSPLAADPRTNINAQNPAGDPDAPSSKTALVVAPYTDQPYIAFKKEVWTEGDTKPRPLASVAQTTTFRELGDDPNGNAALLEKAGYRTTLLLDDKATPGAIFHALQAHPSVVYIATHGGDHLDSAGIAVGGFLGVTRDEPADVRVKRLQDLLMKEGVPGPAAAAVTAGCIDRSEGRAFCFPILWPRFFEIALGRQGIPEGFVFLDACHTAKNTSLARAFKAKTFLGYEPTVAGWASARFTRYLLSNMVRNGHSAREAWDRLRDLCEGAYVVWLEDSILSKVQKGDVDLREEAKGLVAWGINQQPYERVGTETAWLLKQARWSSKDINKGAEALGRCFDLFWKIKKRPGIGEPFCTAGIATSTPTEKEVEDARHLVSGKPVQPVGRFVLR